MKITLVASSSPFNREVSIKGMDRYIYYIGDSMRKMGNEVELLVRDDINKHPSWIKPVPSPKFSWLVYPYFLSNAVRRAESDVFHAEYVTSGAGLMMSGKRPAVVSIHDVIPFTYDWKKLTMKTKIQTQFYMRWFNSVREADALIVMSEFSRDQAIKYAGVDEEKLRVVYNGVDTSFFFPKKRRKSDRIRIGYLGGLDGRKNVRLLVDTFKSLVAERDDIELHVGGGGVSLQSFRDMKIKNANFYGFLPEDKLNDFYNSLDVFVFPSLHEGFGNMALEAMACGVPIVVANRSSLPEVVGDAGIVAEPDVRSMSASICRLVDSAPLRKKMSRKGLKRAGEFSWDECARNTLEVYESVV